MIKDDDDIFGNLLQRFDRRRNTPVDVGRTELGPYRLPRCIGQQGLVVVNQTTAELVLKTDKDQVVRIPMSAQLIEQVGQLLSAMPSGYLAGFKSDR
jgi:hypothetical protein